MLEMNFDELIENLATSETVQRRVSFRDILYPQADIVSRNISFFDVKHILFGLDKPFSISRKWLSKIHGVENVVDKVFFNNLEGNFNQGSIMNIHYKLSN